MHDDTCHALCSASGGHTTKQRAPHHTPLCCCPGAVLISTSTQLRLSAGARLLGTREFLNEVGKAGGFRRDVAAFHERWVAGRGCPRLTAGFQFHRKRAVLELALRQAGPAAARAAAQRAAAAASSEGSSVGIVKVRNALNADPRW